ncbi:MAG: NAD(P)-dependent oxidoreductase [Bdellovibrionota bacterium]|nr:NAD(P)-dependent oxidoreductase [Bdellovibrionota bacterium]
MTESSALTLSGLNVGWIGTGVMGLSMAKRLQKERVNLFVHNRTKEKARDLLNEGAVWVDRPCDLIEKVNIVFMMVGLPEDVHSCIFGENGFLQSEKELSGKVVVDMTTSSPSLALKVGEMLGQRGALSLDAPVSGGDIGAVNGTLSIMVGGDEAAFQKLRYFWEILGKTIVYHGSYGLGQHAKMVNQTLIATNMIGVSEALLYAYKVGMDPWKVLESVESGAAASWSLSQLGRRILKKDFTPGFYVDHFIKDMGIALEEAKKMDLGLPGLSLAHQLYLALKDQGGGQLGTQALYKALERINNISS